MEMPPPFSERAPPCKQKPIGYGYVQYNNPINTQKNGWTGLVKGTFLASAVLSLQAGRVLTTYMFLQYPSVVNMKAPQRIPTS
eukprot:1160634-Pelagomonas_calceolata.AAC.6